MLASTPCSAGMEVVHGEARPKAAYVGGAAAAAEVAIHPTYTTVAVYDKKTNKNDVLRRRIWDSLRLVDGADERDQIALSLTTSLKKTRRTLLRGLRPGSQATSARK